MMNHVGRFDAGNTWIGAVWKSGICFSWNCPLHSLCK